jgi:hypothetical protein
MGFAVLMHDFNLTVAVPGNQVTEINNWRNANNNDWLPG